MKKVGIIRCRETIDMCPGIMCFRSAEKHTGAFEELGEAQIIGFVDCGGCPGKRAISRAKKMEELGANVIMLASCISQGTPIDFVCPHLESIKTTLEKKLNPKTALMTYTH